MYLKPCSADARFVLALQSTSRWLPVLDDSFIADVRNGYSENLAQEKEGKVMDPPSRGSIQRTDLMNPVREQCPFGSNYLYFSRLLHRLRIPEV